MVRAIALYVGHVTIYDSIRSGAISLSLLQYDAKTAKPIFKSVFHVLESRRGGLAAMRFPCLKNVMDNRLEAFIVVNVDCSCRPCPNRLDTTV